MLFTHVDLDCCNKLVYTFFKTTLNMHNLKRHNYTN